MADSTLLGVNNDYMGTGDANTGSMNSTSSNSGTAGRYSSDTPPYTPPPPSPGTGGRGNGGTLPPPPTPPPNSSGDGTGGGSGSGGSTPPPMTADQARQILSSGIGDVKTAQSVYYGTPASGGNTGTTGAYNPNDPMVTGNVDLSKYAPPKPYAPFQTGSNDPNVFTTGGYIKNLNQNGIQQQFNRDNANTYQNYMVAYSNWQQNEAQRKALGLPSQPPPDPPKYEQFDQSGFDKQWAAGSDNGYNAAAMDNLTQAAGGSATPAPMPIRQDTPINQPPGFPPHGTPFSTLQGNQQGYPPGFPPNPYQNLFGGGAGSIYNSTGIPGMGNPFQYMTGQSSNPLMSAASANPQFLQNFMQMLGLIGFGGGGAQMGGFQPWGQSARGNPFYGSGIFV